MTPYTRHQLLVLLVVLLGAGLGLAVGHWRRAHPDLVERLEQLDRGAPPETREAPVAPRGVVGGPTRAGPAGLRSDTRGRVPASRPRAPTAKAPGAPVDLNRAGLDELAGLPGVGRALAARIVAAREAAGRFTSADDLRRVRGLGRAKIERLRPLVGSAE